MEGAERMRTVCRECLDCVQLNMKHAEPGSPENVAGEDQLFPLLFSKYSDLKVSPKLQLCLHQPDRKLASAKKKNKAREGDRRVLEEEAVALYRLTLLRR